MADRPDLKVLPLPPPRAEQVVGFICHRRRGRGCEPIRAGEMERHELAAERIRDRGELLTVEGIVAELAALDRAAGPQGELPL